MPAVNDKDWFASADKGNDFAAVNPLAADPINLSPAIRDACLEAGVQALIAMGISAGQVPSPRWLTAVVLRAVTPIIQADPHG